MNLLLNRRSDDDEDSSGGNDGGGGDQHNKSTLHRNHTMANGSEPPLGCRPYSPVAKTLVISYYVNFMLKLPQAQVYQIIPCLIDLQV